eukprot:GFYU01000622.1.p2 GENE.GFYU01000622.1~~GFYU01000622.1.p2  ORF type:complete len:185 (-),score=46.38 GFYU01000622.1:116-670(-)
MGARDEEQQTPQTQIPQAVEDALEDFKKPPSMILYGISTGLSVWLMVIAIMWSNVQGTTKIDTRHRNIEAWILFGVLSFSNGLYWEARKCKTATMSFVYQFSVTACAAVHLALGIQQFATMAETSDAVDKYKNGTHSADDKDMVDQLNDLTIQLGVAAIILSVVNFVLLGVWMPVAKAWKEESK